MIIYVSSYPRSGSSLMQQIVNNFFEKPWTEVESTYRSLDKVIGVPDYFENWRYDKQVITPPQSLLNVYWNKLNRKIFKSYNLSKWIAFYDLKIPPYDKNCRYLLPGCKDVLTTENRKKLAREKTYFFVKTHHLPFQEYFENEYVIQITRHPAQVFLSYQTFIKTYSPNTSINLDKVIAGQVPFGSWSMWHKEWNKISPTIQKRFLRLDFQETISHGQLATCQQIEDLIKLDYNKQKDELDFGNLRRKYPNYYRQGVRLDWQNQYSREQLKLIGDLHGEIISEFSYQI